MKKDPITPETRREVHSRSGGRCELGCGQVATHLHHRKLRRHGDHRAVNLLHVCFSHHDRIHREVAESISRGWIVPSGADPANVPVFLP